MNSKDIQTLNQIRNSLMDPTVEVAVKEAAIANPLKEVESSLSTLLTHRTEKLKSAFEFEELVRDTISTRISEASFSQLLQALEVIQNGNNRATESLIAPFMNNAALVEAAQNRNSSTENAAAAVYAKTDDKKILQGLVALNQLLDIIKDKQAAAEAEVADATVVSSNPD